MLRYYYSIMFICLIIVISTLRVLYLLEVQYVSGKVPDNGYLVKFQSYRAAQTFVSDPFIPIGNSPFIQLYKPFCSTA
jgi:hypothetical protein